MSKGMNVEAPLANYIAKIIQCVSTSKVLYLDNETRGIIAQLLSQSDALAQDVFLIHQLGVKIPDHVGKSNLSHLCAIIFVRPTNDNIEEIIKHLHNPKHAQYYLFFSNILEESQLGRLAGADKYEVVSQVQELFADVYPLNSDLWTLKQRNQCCLYDDEKQWNASNAELLEREVSGLTAFLLAVKKRPLIRWQKSSSVASRLALKMKNVMETENELFGWSEPMTKPLLIICDRREDPITPLLSQWTYQAMVHELIGIENSRCKLPTDKKGEIVLNPFNDKFFASNLDATFGDLGSHIKKMVDKFSKHVSGAKNMQSIEDMQKFVENYPEYLAKQGNVTKHVAVMGELSKIVAQRKLLDISAIEQEIVCSKDPQTHWMEVEKAIRNPSISDFDKLRLAMIYALRYEGIGKHGRDSELRSLLRDNITDEMCKNRIVLLDVLLREFGSKKREMSLFEEQKNDNIFKKIGSLVNSGLQGVQNVYTQHNPLLTHIIDNAVKCKLPFTQFPSFQGTHKRQLSQPKDIIIYICGGATYEEALAVTKKNKEYGRETNIVLGSGTIHNSKSFLDDIQNHFAKNIIKNDTKHNKF